MKISKRNLIRCIDIVFLIYIICIVLFFIFAESFSIGINEIFSNFALIAIYFGIRIAVKQFYKQKFDINDLKKYQGYYRDLLKQYSAATLSYIDDFDLDYQSILTAHLLELQKKKIIEIKDNNIYVINTPTTELDNYIINSIYDNKIIINEEKYKICVINEAVYSGLLNIRKFNNNDTTIGRALFKMIIMLFGVGLIEFICIILSEFISNQIIGIILVLIFFSGFIAGILIPIYFFVYLIMYINIKTNNIYHRTKKGTEINEKLEGLKNYIKDFGDFENRESKELVLWEEYLIYSVMFNQNKEIVDEYKNFFNY